MKDRVLNYLILCTNITYMNTYVNTTYVQAYISRLTIVSHEAKNKINGSTKRMSELVIHCMYVKYYFNLTHAIIKN